MTRYIQHQTIFASDRLYGASGRSLTSREEFRDRLAAAVDARCDPSFMVIARSDAMSKGVEEALARVQDSQDAGVDAVFLTGKTSIEALAALCSQTGLPLILNDRSPPAPSEELAKYGVRVLIQGHQPYYVMVAALFEALKTLRSGTSQAELQAQSLAKEGRSIAFAESEYALLVEHFLGGSAAKEDGAA